MFKKVLVALAAIVVGVGTASVPATASIPDWDKRSSFGTGASPSSSDLVRLPNRPVKKGAVTALWDSTNRSHAGGGMLLDATEAASSPGMTARHQAWNMPTGVVGSDCTSTLSEMWVGSADSSGATTTDVVIGAGAMSACGTTAPVFAIEAYRNGTWLGWVNNGGTNEFTACTSSAVAGCSFPAWKQPYASLSSNTQYTMKIVYQHQGTSSEGWWVWLQGPGAIPAGYQGWIGYYRKGIWANAASPANQGWSGSYTPWRLGFGEVHDPRAAGSRCVDMGNGNYPNGSGNGAIMDSISAQVPGVSTDFTEQTVWDDPSIYGLDNRTGTSYRYGGTGEC